MAVDTVTVAVMHIFRVSMIIRTRYCYSDTACLIAKALLSKLCVFNVCPTHSQGARDYAILSS